GAGRIAEVLWLERLRLGRVIDFVTALLLEIDRGGEVGQLDHVHVEPPGAAFGQDLAVQRAGLRAHVAALDFWKILGEGVDDGGGAGLVLVAVEHELAFLLRLAHIGIGVEVEHLGRLRRGLRPDGAAGEGRPADRRPRLQQMAAGRAAGVGHCFAPYLIHYDRPIVPEGTVTGYVRPPQAQGDRIWPRRGI